MHNGFIVILKSRYSFNFNFNLLVYFFFQLSCLISTSESSANTDSIRQAKIIPTLDTNKQLSTKRKKTLHTYHK